jgi:hypothetical protein
VSARYCPWICMRLCRLPRYLSLGWRTAKAPAVTVAIPLLRADRASAGFTGSLTV